jgi:glycosyltransferase involved in cell wall biosynthesis
LRILQIIPNPWESIGGVTEYVRNLSQALSLQHDVTVLAAEISGIQPRKDIIEGIKVERYKRLFPGTFYFSPDLLKKIGKYSYDVVHAHNYVTFPFQISYKTNYKKLILSPHFHGFSQHFFGNLLLSLYSPVGKRILEKADTIIAVSQYEKELLQKKLSFKKDIQVIPCGLNLNEYHEKNDNNNCNKSLLYVGRLAKSKGILDLIKVMKQLNDKISLTIIGRGPLKDHIIKLVSDLGIQKRVHLYENLPRYDLLKFYRESDLLVLLSKYEAYSIVVAEALMSGTRCLVSDTSALHEWIDDTNCYGLNYPTKINDLEITIKDILSKPNEVNVSKYLDTKIKDWKDVASKIRDIYSE